MEYIKIKSISITPNPVYTKGNILIQVDAEHTNPWLDYPYDYKYDYTKGENGMSVKTVQAVVNSQTYTLTLNTSTGKYEATITAPSTSSYNQSGHYYGVGITATDNAGNSTTVDATDSTLGASLQLVVKEKVAPVITITSPTASAYITNSKPSIAFTVTDDDSGVDTDTITLSVDGTAVASSGITKTATTGGYTCTYTPTTALADGEHTIIVNASDHDGNAATAKSVTFTVDTVPPTLSVTAPTEGLVTNKSSCTVTGTTNDATSNPVTLTVKLNSGTATAVTVNSDGSFSKALTLTSGTNTITVVATDAAGKTTTVTRTVTLDTGAPVIKSVTINPNPVDAGATYIISVEVTD